MHSLSQSLLALVLFILCVSFLPFVYSTSSCSGQGVMITSAYVDLFYGSNPVVLATSDGGAVMAYQSYTSNKLRLVKYNSEAKVEWVNEANTFCSGTAIPCVPKTIVEDASNPDVVVLYVAGSVTGGYNAFISKYYRKAGAYVDSAEVQQTNGAIPTEKYYTEITSLLMSATGALVFGGFYQYNSMYYTFLGTIGKSSLAVTIKPITNSLLPGSKTILSLTEDDTYYVLTGVLGLDSKPWTSWVGVIDKSSFSSQWEYASTTELTSRDNATVVVLGPGRYSVLATNLFYTIDIHTGVLMTNVFSDVSPASISSNKGMIMLLGTYTTTTSRSFAYYYDNSTNCLYDQGEKADYESLAFMDSDRHPSFSGVWAVGILDPSSSPAAFIAKIDSANPLSCTNTGTINYLNKACYSTLIKGCFGLCGSCLIASDPNACYGATSDDANALALSLFAGRCVGTGEHYQYSPNAAGCKSVSLESCHPLCGGECLAAADSTKCASHCNALEPNIDDSDLGHNTCSCSTGSSYNALVGHCVMNAGCHPLCGTNPCIQENNPSACVQGCNPTATVQTELWNKVYRCECASGTYYDGKGCATLQTEECYALCGGVGCTKAGDSQRCLGCKEGKNVVATRLDAYYYACECTNGTTLIDDQCGYSENCSSHCEGCISQNNESACIACVSGLSPSKSADGNVSCPCPHNTVLFNGSCTGLILDAAKCSPLCAGGCLSPSDPTLCLSCRNETGVIAANRSGDTYACGCNNGTHYTASGECALDLSCGSLCEKCTDSDTCIRCPNKEGMVLRNGQCICSVAGGYVMTKDPDDSTKSTCIEKANTAAKAGQYVGSSVMAVVVITTAIVPGCGSMLWKFLNVAQELLLLSIINTSHLTDGMIATFQGFSFVNFKVFAELFDCFPEEMRGEVGYNALEGNAQYHPSLGGKLFLVNVYSHMFFCILSLLGYLACKILGQKYEFFKRRSDAYMYNGAICTVQSCFIDVTLAAIIQLKYYAFDRSAFYTISCISAAIAVLLEAAFVVGSLYLVYKPADTLVDEEYKSNYGALYEDLVERQPALLTTIFHDARLLVLIFFLVFLDQYEQAQSAVFFVSAVVGVAWDVSMNPFAGKLLTVEMFCLNFAKIIAAGGYLILALTSISDEMAEGLCVFEFVVFLGDIGVGLLALLGEQMLGLQEKLRECMQGKPEESKAISAAESTTNVTHTQTTAMNHLA